MTLFFSALKGVIGLALAVFLALVAWGVYTALDSATSSYGCLVESGAAEVQAENQRVS